MHTREEEPQDPTKRYDTRDLPMGGVIKGVVGFFVFTIVMGPLGCASMSLFGGNVGKPYLGQEPLPLQDDQAYNSRRLPKEPNPILQDNFTAKADLHNLRKAENDVLDNNSINPTTKTRTIPIGEAIDQEAARHGN